MVWTNHECTKNQIRFIREGSVDIINLKCDPELISLLRNEQGILPAYHMNKEHWITIVLDCPFPKEEIYKLINLSYDLTK